MEEKIKNLVTEALSKLTIEEKNFTVEHPEDLKNGDYATNAAMVAAKKLRMNPKDLAGKMLIILNNSKGEIFEKIEIAGPGFINFYLSRKFFTESIKEILKKSAEWGKNNALLGKRIMIEYTDPNPFKPFHMGQLMTNAIGEALARILEFSQAETFRVNYQGDVGLHVAKAIYGLQRDPYPLKKEEKVAIIADYIGKCYAKGNDSYEMDPGAKKEIDKINKKLYTRKDEEINKIYDWGKDVTLKAFEEIYQILGTKFNHYFFESEVAPIGEKIVKENTPKVFQESDGAIVFKGGEHNPKLHTRVFITSKGLPTYETKELGLTETKFNTEKNLDLSVVVTAHEQGEYMKVVQKAISLIHPDYEKRMKHITHGMMRFAQGKMSSRKGNVVTGESLLRDVIHIISGKLKDRDIGASEKEKIAEIVGVAAIKYSILRSRIGGDIMFDFEQSISVEGDSGPYLQYSAIRAKSVLEKARS